jgi:hypothetical protein
MQYEKTKTAPITFRATAEDRSSLSAIASANNVPASEVLRTALREHVAKSASELSSEAAEAIVVEAAPMIEAQFGALVRSLEGLNARLDALEARR